MTRKSKVLTSCKYASDFLRSYASNTYNFECGSLLNDTDKDWPTFCVAGLPVKEVEVDGVKCLVPVMAGDEANAEQFIINPSHPTSIEAGCKSMCPYTTLARGCAVVCKEGLPDKDPCGNEYDKDALCKVLEEMSPPVVCRSNEGLPVLTVPGMQIGV